MLSWATFESPITQWAMTSWGSPARSVTTRTSGTSSLRKGHLIFGRMSGGRYDPCAFDALRRKGSDAPVVRVDHEEILSFERLGQPTPLARSFKELLDSGLGVESRGRTTRG